MAHFLDVMTNVCNVDGMDTLTAFELASRAVRESDGDSIRCTALISGMLRTHFNFHGGFMHLLCRAIESRSDVSYSKAMQSVFPTWLSRQQQGDSLPFEGSLSSAMDTTFVKSTSSALVKDSIAEPVASVLYNSMLRHHEHKVDRKVVLECVSCY